jgi:hypothetical protein
MIGTRIRGFKHLVKLTKDSGEIGFFFKKDFVRIEYGVALYASKDACSRPFGSTMKTDYLLIFSNCNNNVSLNLSSFAGTSLYGRISELTSQFCGVWFMPLSKGCFTDEGYVFSQMVAVPADFEGKYKEFCNANKKQMSNVLKYGNIDMPLFKYFFSISDGSKNFFFWAVNAFFKQNVSIYLLENVLLWNGKYSQLTNKLGKKTITGYTSCMDLFRLTSELSKLRREKRANDVINMFNTAQKKALKTLDLTARDYDTLSKFAKLSPKKKNNFIRKMSTIEDPVEILKQMSFLADVHFEWNKESLIEFIKNTDNFNCEVVIDRGDMLLLKVKDYETVKRLAKTTNWCISKDKKYWNEYVANKPDSTQYVILDFSKKEDDNLSIVGFTSIHDRGITNAHDFQNNNLMRDSNEPRCKIRSFVSRSLDSRSIYSILNKNGINISDVVTYEPSPYEWNRDAMFAFLNQCIDPEDYYIIHDDGDRLVIVAESDDIKYFLGNTFIGITRLDKYDQVIMFVDFTKHKANPERLVYGVIRHNFKLHESYCGELFNIRSEHIPQTFDSKLDEYDLPYDIICRRNDVVQRFYNAFSEFEIGILRKLITYKDVILSLKKKEKANFVKEYIKTVMFHYKSFDYIDLFYDNGILISEVIGDKSTGDIVLEIVNDMLYHCNENTNYDVPSENDINDLFNGRIGNRYRNIYIANFIMLMKMVDNENNRTILHRILAGLCEKGFRCDLFDLVITRILSKINTSNNMNTELIKMMLSYAINNHSSRVINAIKSYNIQNDAINNIINSYKPIDNTMKVTDMWVKGNDAYEYVVEERHTNV